MQVQRFLASPWATVHGPSDPRRLLVWLLDAGFRGLGVSPGPRSVDWSAVRAAAADLPVEVAAVRAGSALAVQSATFGLASQKDEERRQAVRVVHQSVATARLLGCQVVVFEPGLVPVFGEIEAEDLGEPNYSWTPERAQALLARRKVGRNAALDRACREVFGLAKAFPDMEFCLTGGRSLRAVADLEGLRDLFEDLSSLKLGYWHDAAVCARRQQVLGEAQGEWLEAFGNRCRGFGLGDASPDAMYHPPGSGGVDYGLLASYVPRSGGPFPMVLDLDPAVLPSELAGIRACLDKFGL
jgi:sugar phosphate isomerase/epimerase